MDNYEIGMDIMPLDTTSPS